MLIPDRDVVQFPGPLTAPTTSDGVTILSPAPGTAMVSLADSTTDGGLTTSEPALEIEVDVQLALSAGVLSVDDPQRGAPGHPDRRRPGCGDARTH